MVKTLLLFLAFAGFCSAKCYASPYDAKHEAHVVRINDSLLRLGIDTMLIFERRCSGCIEGAQESAYIFWQKFGQINCIGVDNWKGRTNVENQLFTFSYYFKVKHLIETETVDSSILAFHYGFWQLKLIINKEIKGYHVPDYFRLTNEASALINYIYMLEYHLNANQPFRDE